MPFARGTVNGITGLLRKAGAFVKACCCKKWKCDVSTYTCTEDPYGPYKTESECRRNCEDKKYKCNTTTYDCTEDPLGPYDTIKECEDNCKEDKYYCCGSLGSPDDRDCYGQPCDELSLASYGVYDTQEECDDECKVTHYKCDVSTYDCTEDPTGPYTDPKVCEDNCNPPPMYKCDVQNYDCTQDPLGTYDTLQECLDNCKEPKYYCCGSPGTPTDRDCYGEPCSEVGLDSIGEYDTQEECDRECQPEYYYCCRQSDGSVVCTTDCTGGTQVSGPYETSDECECDAFRCDKSTYTCVQDPDGPYKTPDECESECKRKYDCVDNGDGTKSCVEVEGGPYESSDCDKQCDPRYDCVRDLASNDVSCIEKEGGTYLSSDCNDECDKRYDCVDNGDGTKSCAETPGGSYTTSNCDDECDLRYSCVDGGGFTDCVETVGGPYADDTCGGACDDGFIASCCTDYGISVTTRKQCDNWGGTFYTDTDLALADCGCDDCWGIGGDYCMSDGVPCGEGNAALPDAKCENSGVEVAYYSSGRSEQGSWMTYFCDNGDCSPLSDLIAKNAQIIGWLDYASEYNTKPSAECCLGTATGFRYEYRVFALNCRKKQWEAAPNVMAGQNTFTQGSTIDDPTAFCNDGSRPGDPQRPDALVRDSRPTCIPPPVNPLP